MNDGIQYPTQYCVSLNRLYKRHLYSTIWLTFTDFYEAMKIGDTVFAILAILVGSKCFMHDVLTHLTVRCTAYAADEDTFNTNKTHNLIRRLLIEEYQLKKTEATCFGYSPI